MKTQIPFHLSLRFRLSMLVAIAIFSVVMATAGFSAWRSFGREIDNHRGLLQGAGSAYVAALAEPVSAMDQQGALSILRGVRNLPDVLQSDINLADGQSFVQLGSGALLLRESGDPASMSASELWSARYLRFEFPIIKGGQTIATLGLLSDVSGMRRAVINSLLVTLAAALVAIAIGIMIAQVLIVRMTRPLRQLTAVMSNFAEDTEAALPSIAGGTDETGILAGAFNNMVGSIRERDRRIARHLESLEETVDLRTRDLRAARDEAEFANAAKSEFLATMSHEIRTPMNGMLVMAEMLSAADLSTRHRRYADIIWRSGKGLLTIINDILDLSKIESGNLTLEAIPTSAEDMAIDVASLFWERARDSGLELATYVSPRVPALVLGDPTRLNQVITNLVNNALKFTETGGVMIRLDAMPAQDDDSVLLILEVEDTGIGIPADKIDSIFESFSQADQSTTRRFGGTGLGLSVCRKLVSAMGGKIEVTSEPGKGSTFRVTLCMTLAEAATETPVLPLRVAIGLPPGLEHRALASALADLGCEVTDDRPQLIISKSGAVTDRPAGGNTPRVVLTDIGDTQVDGLLATGAAADCLAAPYSRAELASLLLRATTGTLRGVSALHSDRSISKPASFEGLRVLAADDNAVNREVLREALYTLNVEVAFVENGAEAVQRVCSETFDLVFMDGSMPVMDGIEAVRQIRVNEVASGKRRTPIVALTAQVAGHDAGAWQAAGVEDYVTKPFSLAQLSQVIQTISGGSCDHACAAPALEEAEVPLLNPQTIQTLDTLGASSGRNVRARIWSMFEERAVPDFAELQLMPSSRPLLEISRKAHALKSIALNSGAERLARHLEAIEIAAASDSPHDEIVRMLTDAGQTLRDTLISMQTHPMPQREQELHAKLSA